MQARNKNKAVDLLPERIDMSREEVKELIQKPKVQEVVSSTEKESPNVIEAKVVAPSEEVANRDKTQKQHGKANEFTQRPPANKRERKKNPTMNTNN